MEKFISRSLLNSFVEGFGVIHQVPTLVFRNDSIGKDYNLYLLDTIVDSNIKDFDIFENEQRTLLIFFKLNLKTVTSFEIEDKNILTLHFEDIWIKLSSNNEYEFLQIGCESKEKIEMLIINSDGTFSVWD